jgi:CubicO group peptidase (beta-lactamase class C family)
MPIVKSAGRPFPFFGPWAAAATAIWLAFAAVAHARQATETATSAPAAAPTLEQRLERLCEQLEQQRLATHIPGLAIAIVKDDQVILSRGFGVRDIEKSLPVTDETVFAVGSTTKAFTAALVAMMIDEGKMAWDDPVRKHLPQFHLSDPVADEQITIRDLLCHRSGLSRTDLLWASGKASRAEILAAVARIEPTAKFREKFQYQNIMFMAAGMASANAAGLDGDWERLLNERLLQPLNMQHSTTSIDAARAGGQLSLGYNWDEQQGTWKHLPMRALAAIAPAGAINSSAREMAQWVRFQLGRGEIDGRRLLASERFDEMWSKHMSLSESPEARGAKLDYGLGWMLQDWKGKRVVEHGGNIDGFAAEVALLPEERIGYVLLANVSATPLQQMSVNLVFEALLGEWKEDAPPPIDVAAVQEYLGKYRVDVLNTDATVLIKDGRLAVDVPRQMVFLLKPPDEQGKWFFEITDQIAVSFERDAGGRVVSMTFYQSGIELECPREGVTLPVEISLDDAQKYCGKYRDEEEKMDVTVLHRNGRLAVDVPNEMVYDLRLPDAEGKWALRINDAIAVRFEQGDDGQITAMTMFHEGKERLLPRAADPPAIDIPGADEVLALHEQACGSSRVAGLGSVRITGRLSMPSQGIFDSIITYLCADATHYLQHLDMGNFGSIKAALNGETGWTDSTFQPLTELPPDAAAALRFQHPLLPVADWKSDFTSIETTRLDSVDGRDVIVVQLDAGHGLRCAAHVDRESGYVPKLEFSTIIPGLPAIETTALLTDWRDVAGIKFPFHWEIENDLFGKTIVEVEKFETAVDLPPGVFEARANGE